jgi:hypothetical protein
MKTPMQELLEWVRATLPMDLETPQMIEQKIESLLEKEKHHFICYSLGYLEVHQFVHPDEFYNTFINFEDDNIKTNEK